MRSGECRYVPDDVGLASGLVRRSRLSAGTCSGISAYCGDLSGEVVLVSGRVRRVELMSRRVQQGLLIVGTCP